MKRKKIEAWVVDEDRGEEDGPPPPSDADYRGGP
jgi:hypothetical protein